MTPASARVDKLEVVLEAYELARAYDIQRLEHLLLMDMLHRMDMTSASCILARALEMQAFDLVGVAVDFLARAWCMGVTGLPIPRFPHESFQALAFDCGLTSS